MNSFSMESTIPTTLASETVPTYLGYIGAGVAVLFFGSNFVPIKKFETGDGMFFQWVLCSAIWCVGLVTNIIRGFPTFYFLPMLGGFLWSTGNAAVVPIVKTVGLSQGLLVWGSVNLLCGWASGRFGLFGLHAEIPNNLLYNYIGTALCTVSAIIFIFIKTDTSTRVNAGKRMRSTETEDDDPLIPISPNIGERVLINAVAVEEQTFLDKLSATQKKVVGITLCIFSGVLYGVNFAPVIYVQDNYPGASQNGLDYVFAHFCGIITTSTVYFIIYCAYMQNRPRVYPQAILPGYLSGIMWGIADVGWFIANATLSEPVSFPIITAGPGIVGAVWGVFVFGEIKGKRNILVLLLAFAVTFSGIALTALSKT